MSISDLAAPGKFETPSSVSVPKHVTHTKECVGVSVCLYVCVSVSQSLEAWAVVGSVGVPYHIRTIEGAAAGEAPDAVAERLAAGFAPPSEFLKSYTVHVPNR